MFVEHIVTKFSTDDKKFENLVKYGTRIELVNFKYAKMEFIDSFV